MPPELSTCFFLCLGMLPAFFCLFGSSSAFTLDLETQIRLETTGVDLSAELVEVAQFVIDGLGTLLFGANSAFEFVQYRLPLIRRDNRQVSCRHLALVFVQTTRVHQRRQCRCVVYFARVFFHVFCCCSCFYITTTTTYRL